MDRSYEDAIKVIDGRRRQRRPVEITPSVNAGERMPASNGTPDFRGTPSIVGMSEWLQMLGHSPRDINNLNVIHIAGTKGKGSTCAFTESFLRAHGHRTGYPRKTGLYTSPHLIDPEDRIRINSQPLSRSLLAKYFFEVYDLLPQLHVHYDPSKAIVERGPRYLQLWALLAFHVFIREKVDAAIIETHNGGEYDATNIVEKPIVTAITTLGMDHIAQLGPTIENIAWHKAGIYKPGAVALSTVQEAAPAEVLKTRADERGEEITFVGDDTRLPDEALQLKPSIQRKNASLAAAAAEAFLSRTVPFESRELAVADVHAGVAQWSWPGRFQIMEDGKRTWFLDAAHNDMSVKLAAQWFAETSESLQKGGAEVVQILIFSHINELRDATQLLETLASALRDCKAGVQHVIFTTYDGVSLRDSTNLLEDASILNETWNLHHPHSQIWHEPTIQRAVDCSRAIAKDTEETQTLVTGSQHLVGPALRILQSEG